MDESNFRDSLKLENFEIINKDEYAKYKDSLEASKYKDFIKTKNCVDFIINDSDKDDERK